MFTGIKLFHYYYYLFIYDYYSSSDAWYFNITLF